MVFDKSEGMASGPVRKSRPRPQQIAPATTIGTPSRPAGIAGFVGSGNVGPRPRPTAKSNSSGQYSAPAPSAPRISRPQAPAIQQPGPVQRPGFERPATNSQPAGGGGKGGGKGKPVRNGAKLGDWGPGKPGFSDPRPMDPNAPKPGTVQAVGIPSVDEYLMSDTTYQGGLSQLMKDLADFQAGNQSEQNSVSSAFQTALERMTGERTNALQSLEEDFASRGLLNSGLYADAISDYDNTYNQQIEDLTGDKTNSLNALLAALGQQTSLNQSSQQALREQAIMNRAKQYGITP